MLRAYQTFNESLDSNMVFHLGRRSGFFSEYNSMIRCMLYCLQHQIQFQLYSRDLSIATHRGWTDFFQPFCPERTNAIHRLFNSRFPRPTPQFKLRRAFGPLTKKLARCDYLTYELWNAFNDPSAAPTIQNPTCLAARTNREIFRKLIRMTWRFQPQIAREIHKKTDVLSLPERYLALHIRAGDKWKECRLSPAAAYMQKLSTLSDLRHALVMSDDYRIYEQLVSDYPEWTFYTLEHPRQTGYHHRQYQRKARAEKRDGTLRFLAGIELAAHATHFVGTLSSNVGSYLHMRMGPQQCIAIDADQPAKRPPTEGESSGKYRALNRATFRRIFCRANERIQYETGIISEEPNPSIITM